MPISLQQPEGSNFSTVKEAFGPKLTDDLPKTPLPTLVYDSHEELSTPPVPLVLFDGGEVVVQKNTNSAIKLLFSKVPDPESLFFRDGRRKIDMVLVYEEEELGVMTEAEAKRRDKRRVFQVCRF